MKISLTEAEVPLSPNPPAGWPNVVKQFTESNMESAKVNIDTDEPSSFAVLNRAYVGLSNAIKRQKAPVRVIQREGHVYLKRTG
jgi:hypothetical protein